MLRNSTAALLLINLLIFRFSSSGVRPASSSRMEKKLKANFYLECQGCSYLIALGADFTVQPGLTLRKTSTFHFRLSNRNYSAHVSRISLLIAQTLFLCFLGCDSKHTARSREFYFVNVRDTRATVSTRNQILAGRIQPIGPRRYVHVFSPNSHSLSKCCSFGTRREKVNWEKNHVCGITAERLSHWAERDVANDYNDPERPDHSSAELFLTGDDCLLRCPRTLLDSLRWFTARFVALIAPSSAKLIGAVNCLW